MIMSVAKQKWYDDRKDTKPDGILGKCQHYLESANARKIARRGIPNKDDVPCL